jgi:hypothetical protein
MPEGFSAQGTVIARSIDPTWPPQAPVGGSVSFQDISELRDITPPALTRNELETTTHNEESDAYLVGIKRHGTMTFMINWVPDNASHDEITGLQQAWDEGTRDIYRITFPDGTRWIFSGFVTNFAPTANVDSVLTADVTIRPTGGHIIQSS